jgi:Tfp pilus assembly protein PilV
LQVEVLVALIMVAVAVLAVLSIQQSLLRFNHIQL